MTHHLLISRVIILLLLLALSTSQVGYGQSHFIEKGQRSLSNNRQLKSSDQKASPKQETTEAMVKWEDYIDVFQELSESVSKLKEKLGKTNQQSLEAMEKHSDFLSYRWRSSDGGATPATYFESLKQNVSLLKSVLDNQVPEKEVSPLLQIVEQDLGIKAKHCELSAKGWNALIVVSVNARKGNEQVDGLEVWFVPKGWAKVESKWKRFGKVTCGTSEKLAPGVYMMWLKGLTPVPIDIGGNGSDTKEVDLVVP